MKQVLQLLLLLLPLTTHADIALTNSSPIEVQFDAANKLYAQGKFADAAAAYHHILAAGSISPVLYFNMGNAYFKAGRIGNAIAAYREAEEMSPRDPDIRANVQFARKQVPGPRLKMAVWRQKLGALSANEWMALSTAAVWITLGLLMARLIKPALNPILRSWIVAAIVGSLVIIATAKLAIAQSNSERTAIITTSDATIRNGPFDESPSAFTAHDGAELRIIDHKDDWLQVTDGGSNTGWVKRTAVEVSERS